MGTFHDAMATKCGDQVLSHIRAGDSRYQQIFSTSMSRVSDWEWPRPDYVCFDAVNSCTYAMEFKPTNQSKREYLCGLGQSLSYLQKHMYSGLIVPTVADDGFRISSFINDTLQADEFKDVGISLYEYDPKTFEIEILRGIKTQRSVNNLKIKEPKNSTFWCWWRDMSNYELFDLLSLSFKYNEKDDDIYSKYIYPEFWDRLSKGSTLMWEGVNRKPMSLASKNASKQNYKIPLSQLELWNASTGKLTERGLKLLQIGKMYGANSEVFLTALSYLILVDGKHLELIKKVEDYQKELIIPNKSNDFLLLLENALESDGYIGARKPTARKGKPTGKPSYIRDEPKIWKKLGLFEMNKSKNYFIPSEGYHFDWHKISDVLIDGQRLIDD